MVENFYVALLHYPVYNKHGEVVTTAVTNLDVHDIARASLTYGVRRFYVVTPIAAQLRLVGRLMQHWQEGYGSRYNPSRREAFQITGLKSSLDEVMSDIVNRGATAPKLVATGANLRGWSLTFQDLRTRLREGDGAYLLLFGTGWGMAREVLARADFLLESIKGVADYNHLSVRSAVSITLDRLRGRSETDTLHEPEKRL